MSHLWIKDEEQQWAVFLLLSDTYALEPFLEWSTRTTESGSAVSIVRSSGEENEQWHLLVPHGVRVSVNGLPIITGLRTLRDRDQITIGDRTAYFSTEERVQRVPFPGGERKFFCARCRQELIVGVSAVKCSQCNVWHHQTNELPCWTYAAHCALCSQQTDLEAGYRWQPDD